MHACFMCVLTHEQKHIFVHDFADPVDGEATASRIIQLLGLCAKNPDLCRAFPKKNE